MFVSLFVVFTLSSCIPQIPNSNQSFGGSGGSSGNGGQGSGGDSGGSDVQGGDSSDGADSGSGSQPPASGDSGGSNGDSSGGDSGEGGSDGVPPVADPPVDQRDMSSWKEYIQNIVDDPDSTIKADLNALSLAQQSGLDTSDEFYDMIIDKIRTKMKKTLERSDLCQNDLIPLIELAQLTGIDDVADEGLSRLGKVTAVADLVTGAKKLYSSVPRDCSSVEYKFESGNKEGNFYTVTTASVIGDLKEDTVMNWVNSDARIYSWQRGKIEWKYNDESSDTCLIIKKSSIGRADLSKNDGAVEVYKDGTFYGNIISKSMQVEVSEVVRQLNPKEDCSEYTPKTYTEVGSFSVYINGSWTDKYKITATVNDNTNPDSAEDTETKQTVFTLAKLHIPFPE